MKKNTGAGSSLTLVYALAKIPAVLLGAILFMWVVANPQFVVHILELSGGIFILFLFLAVAITGELRQRQKVVGAVRNGMESAVSICKRNISGYFLSVAVLLIPKVFSLPISISDYAQAAAALVFFWLTRSAFTSSIFWQGYRIYVLTGLFVYVFPFIFNQLIGESDFYQALAALPALALVQYCYRRHGFKNEDEDTDAEQPLCAHTFVGIVLAGSIGIIPYFFGESLFESYVVIQPLTVLAAFFFWCIRIHIMYGAKGGHLSRSCAWHCLFYPLLYIGA